MTDQRRKSNAFETVFTQTTAGYFLREFCFSSTHFTASNESEVELADFVIQLDDLFMIFQVKDREQPSTDPESERKWFKKKIITKATRQIRDTIKYLQSCPPVILNDRGRQIEMPAKIDSVAIVKVIVFNGGEHLPVECARHRFHESQTAGVIHVIAAVDWARIMNTLVTPREIADYLRMRESLCHANSSEARSVSEKALVGQFIAGADDKIPSPKFESFVDRLRDETSEYDMLRFLNLFADRITSEAPTDSDIPADLLDAGTDYYPIVLEIAKLPRTDLAMFKTRFKLAWDRAGRVCDPPFLRMTSSTGVGFVFAGVPTGMENRAQNGLMNFVAAHMYEQKITRCIGASFIHEGEYRSISWILLDQIWQPNPSMDDHIREHPLPPVREEIMPRYRIGEES